MTTIQIVIIVIIVYNSKRRKTKKFNRAFDQFETQNINIPQKKFYYIHTYYYWNNKHGNVKEDVSCASFGIYICWVFLRHWVKRWKSNYNWEGGLNYDNIVLPTAEEYFKWKRKEYSKKIILFDNGAQHTYISKELKEKLNLVPFKQEKIAVNVFDRTEESKVQNIDVKFNVISGRKNVYVGA